MAKSLHIRRNVIASIASFSVNLVLTFLVYRLVINGGGLEALGLWSTLMAWIFLVRMGDVGMATAVLRFIAKCDHAEEPGRIRAYLDTSLALNAGLFLILAFLGYVLFRTFITMIVPSDIESQHVALSVLPIMFASFVLTNLSGIVLGGLTGLHQGYKTAIITTIGMIVQLAIVIPLVPRIGLAGLAWGQFGQHAIMILLGWITILNQIHKTAGQSGGALPLHFSVAALREMLGFSLKTQFANIINGLFEPISKILIGRIGGLALLGQYELAFKIISLPRNAVVAGAHATTPAMTSLLATDRAAARELYRRIMHSLLTKGILVLVATVLLTPCASWFWLARLDLELWFFATMLAVGFAINTMGAPAYLLGLAAGQVQGNILSNACALIVMISLMAIASMFDEPLLAIISSAVGLAVGGIVVRFLNARFLDSENG